LCRYTIEGTEEYYPEFSYDIFASEKDLFAGVQKHARDEGWCGAQSLKTQLADLLERYCT
jgi:hypothetical protein